MANICVSCELPIVDRYLSKVLDKSWHNDCVRCTECQRPLTDKCYSKNDRIYCKDDYLRLYGTKCTGCSNGISPRDLVQRINDKIYHLQCLTCSRCGKEMSPGDEVYRVDNDKLLCKTDYEMNKRTCESDGSPASDEVEGRTNESYGSDDEDGPNGKRRGPRTTIKAKQLETLKAAFAATPKPSRHIREKLAQDTGLTMRVIQVWFQNRRSKERRLKQLSALGGRRGSMRGSKNNSRVENDSLENSPPEAAPVSYPFYPPVNPPPSTSSLEDFSAQRMNYQYGRQSMTGYTSQNGMNEQSMVKSEYNSLNMDSEHSSAGYSFYDNYRDNVNIPSYAMSHQAMIAAATATEVW